MSTRQSIFDKPDFFDKYMEYRNKSFCYTDTVVCPALRAMLPPMSGLAVLDIGSGYGDFCRYAITEGAASVTGLDNSQLMYRFATSRINEPRISLHPIGVEDFDAPNETFDLTVASMTFHYVADLHLAFRKVHRWLKAGGLLVFSMNHPNYTAALEGGSLDRCEREGVQEISRYFDESERKHRWLVDDVVKYHVKMETIVNGLLDVGFVLQRLVEPTASEALAFKYPDLEKTKRVPFCIVVRATKPLSADRTSNLVEIAQGYESEQQRSAGE